MGLAPRRNFVTTPHNRASIGRLCSLGSVNTSACLLTALLVLSLSLSICSSSARKPKPVPSGAQIFQQYCSSCHLGGGNAAKNGKPVYSSHVLATMATFKSYLDSPPGHMPRYKELVENDKLMRALFDYCKTLKKQPSERAFKEPVKLNQVAQK